METERRIFLFITQKDMKISTPIIEFEEFDKADGNVNESDRISPIQTKGLEKDAKPVEITASILRLQKNRPLDSLTNRPCNLDSKKH